MKLLLDTHIFLWYVQNNSQLSQNAKTLIQSSGNEPIVHIASVWEMGIKLSLGKLDIPRPISAFVRARMGIHNIRLAAMTIDQIEVVSQLPFYHRDPFDRLLIAYCIVEGIPLISVDSAFDAYPITRLW
jgi:PIN domain nuclease of toxin-antitoxin system